MGRIEITLETERQPTDEPRQPSDWRRILPGLIVSAVSLGLVFYLADLRKLGEALRLANYWYVFLAVLVTLTWLGVRGLVWRSLLQEKATYKDVFWSLNEGYLLNNLLPFRLGEVGRSYLLARKSGLDFWQVASTIIVERLMDLGLATGLLLSSLPFVVGTTWAREAAIIVGGVVVSGFAALYLVARSQERLLGWVERLSARWPRVLRQGEKAFSSFFAGLSVLTDGRRFLIASGWMLVNWLVAVVQYVVMVNAFFPGGRFLWAVFTLGVAALGIAAPSSPGAIGVLELSIVGALSLFGLDASTALALAITTRVIQYLTSGALGAFALVRDGESLLTVYRRVRRMNV